MKIRIHRINSGKVKFKNLDKFERNDRGHSRRVSNEEGGEPRP